MSDWGVIKGRVAVLEAGLDLEMPGNAGNSDRPGGSVPCATVRYTAVVVGTGNVLSRGR